MDILLGIADDFLFDRLWAKLVPLSAFASSPEFLSSANATSKYLPLGSPSKWTEFVAGLPHPPISPTTISSFTSSGIVPNVSAWPRDYVPRQLLSLTLLTMVGVHIMYFLFAGFSYYFVFNHEMKKHPKYLKDQIKLEIISSLKAFPPLMMMHLPIFQAEVMGYSKLYEGVDTYGYLYFFASVPLFLFFTDYCIYWIHRWLHIPAIYKRLHKPHHKWLVPTPFAAYAFHPLDGMAQAIPYHLFPFVFPLHKMVYLVLFVFVNVWTILIHDSDMITGHPLEKVINGPAHHTLHHLYFTVNYGQYFTWADRVGGSYRQPDSSLDPLLEIKKESAKKEQ